MKIKLSDWAARHYNPPPSMWVLRRWVRDSEIFPPPEKVGCSYYVEETATRLVENEPRRSLVERLQAMRA